MSYFDFEEILYLFHLVQFKFSFYDKVKCLLCDLAEDNSTITPKEQWGENQFTGQSPISTNTNQFKLSSEVIMKEDLSLVGQTTTVSFQLYIISIFELFIIYI